MVRFAPTMLVASVLYYICSFSDKLSQRKIDLLVLYCHKAKKDLKLGKEHIFKMCSNQLSVSSTICKCYPHAIPFQGPHLYQQQLQRLDGSPKEYN